MAREQRIVAKAMSAAAANGAAAKPGKRRTVPSDTVSATSLAPLRFPALQTHHKPEQL